MIRRNKWSLILTGVVTLLLLQIISHLAVTESDSLRIEVVGDSQPVMRDDDPVVELVDDIDMLGRREFVLAKPGDDSRATDSGSLFLFWGEDRSDHSDFKDINPAEADIVIRGDEGDRLGTDFVFWDHNSDGWLDLVVGCPGFDGGRGRVLIFDSYDLRDTFEGRRYNPEWASYVIEGNGTEGYGRGVFKGDLTGSGHPDLAILADKGSGSEAEMQVFFFGGLPDYGVRKELPAGSVSDDMVFQSLDLLSRGKEAMIFSHPGIPDVHMVYLNITINPIDIAGSNSSGFVTFTDSIQSTGDTFGWDQTRDGWDESPAHVYDNDTISDLPRFNQYSGNARGDDRSVENVDMLQIEVGGGTPSDSGGEAMSGAYGVSFEVIPSDLVDIDSVEITLDWEYFCGGLEMDERMWLKGRLWDSYGDPHWLGTELDGPPISDPTPEIHSVRGEGSNPGDGPDKSGSNSMTQELYPFVNRAGTYYLDLGGKINKWTSSSEYMMAGFDNIRISTRKVDHELITITGSSGFGFDLHSMDVDLDGYGDLLVSSTGDGTLDIFSGDGSLNSSLPLDQDDANITIGGMSTGSNMIRSERIGPSPLNTEDSLVISDTGPVTENGSGVIHLFDTPLSDGNHDVSESDETMYARYGLMDMGWDMISPGDIDNDGYSDLIVFSWSGEDQLVTIDVDREDSYPEIEFLNPLRMQNVTGEVEIRVEVFDFDGDADPADVQLMWSRDDITYSTFNYISS